MVTIFLWPISAFFSPTGENRRINIPAMYGEENAVFLLLSPNQGFPFWNKD